MSIEKIYEDIKNRANDIYESYTETICKELPQRYKDSVLDFKINNDKEINGCAWSEEGTDHVEINDGVINLYYEYFYKLKENEKNDFLKMIFPKRDSKEIEKSSCEGVLLKNDLAICFDSKIVDESMAIMLDVFVLRFILVHEFGHIFNGHCLWVKSKENFISRIPMFCNNESYIWDDKTALDMRTLEMDADAYAITQSINHLFYLYYNFESQVMVKSMSPIDLFYWWALAIRSHFLVCEKQYNDSNYKKRMLHLPSIARWCHGMEIILKIIDESYISKDLKESICVALAQGATDAEKKFEMIYKNSSSWIQHFQEEENYKKYIDEVNENWKRIRPELDQYSRTELAM